MILLSMTLRLGLGLDQTVALFNNHTVRQLSCAFHDLSLTSPRGEEWRRLDPEICIDPMRNMPGEIGGGVRRLLAGSGFHCTV